MLLALSLLFPEQPCKRHGDFQKTSNPETTHETCIRLGQVRPGYRTYKKKGGPEETTISVRILRKWSCEELSIAHQVTVQTRQNNGGHRIVFQHPARYDLARALEREKGDGGKVGSGERTWDCESEELVVVSGDDDGWMIGNDGCCCNDGNNGDEQRLYSEVGNEDPSPLRAEETMKC